LHWCWIGRWYRRQQIGSGAEHPILVDAVYEFGENGSCILQLRRNGWTARIERASKSEPELVSLILNLNGSRLGLQWPDERSNPSICVLNAAEICWPGSPLIEESPPYHDVYV
jgi:hypothetical protein